MASFSAFRRNDDGAGVVAQFDEALIALLTDVFENVLAVLDDEVDGIDEIDSTGQTSYAAENDPLAAALGIGTATTLPDNPVLARLLPDAYPDDPQASGDFRRYTEQGLRERKRAALTSVMATLVEGPQVLDDTQARAWLAALNDARLALGTWLGVTEDNADEELDPGASDFQAYLVYDLLSFLQESMLQAVAAPDASDPPQA